MNPDVGASRKTMCCEIHNSIAGVGKLILLKNQPFLTF